MPQSKTLPVVTCFLLIAAAHVGRAQPFSEIVVFDRSLSVVRNGRASNGLLWSEWLASQLNLPTAEQNGTSYWVSDLGALEPEVTSYLEARNPLDDSLVIVGIALTSNPERKSEYWAEMSSQISRLAEKGAEHFIVIRNDFIGYSQVGGPFRDQLRELNEFGDPILNQLAEDLGVRIYRPSADRFSGFTVVLEDPGQFGFTNLTDPAGTAVPNPDEYVWWDSQHPTTAAHRHLALDAFQSLGISVEPTSILVHGNGEEYVQDFDTGLHSMNDRLPEGWTGVTDDARYTSLTGGGLSGTVKIGAPGALYAAGDRSDKALTVGVIDNQQQYELQLNAEVVEASMQSLRLQFDLEAWGANPLMATASHEAAFDVSVEASTGNGFTPLLDLGRVTSGPLTYDSRGHLDGDTNRVSFDSAIVPASVPSGALLRVRWSVPNDVLNEHYVFGIDNVILSVLPLVDFDSDGEITAVDVDLVSAEAAAGGSSNLDFDVTSDSVVNNQDVERLLSLANRLNGDANFDGAVQFADFLVLSGNFGLSGKRWSEGDFDSSGSVQFADFLILADNFGQSAATSAAVSDTWKGGGFDHDRKGEFSEFHLLAGNSGQTSGTVKSVPEPTGLVLAVLASILLSLGRSLPTHDAVLPEGT